MSPANGVRVTLSIDGAGTTANALLQSDAAWGLALVTQSLYVVLYEDTELGMV